MMAVSIVSNTRYLHVALYRCDLELWTFCFVLRSFEVKYLRISGVNITKFNINLSIPCMLVQTWLQNLRTTHDVNYNHSYRRAAHFTQPLINKYCPQKAFSYLCSTRRKNTNESRAFNVLKYLVNPRSIDHNRHQRNTSFIHFVDKTQVNFATNQLHTTEMSQANWEVIF